MQSILFRYGLMPLVVVVLVLAGTARADRVSRLISQLENGSAKQRLSAALSLTNSGDKRAIAPLIAALSDSDKTIRGVAATALRKLVDGSVSAGVRKRAISVLKRAAKKDHSSFVRSQAKKAYKTIMAIGNGSKVFIDIGPMGDKTSRSKTWKRVMARAVAKSLGKSGWKIGGKMSKRQLKRKKMDAFHIRGTLTRLTLSSTVSCKVSMLIATYPAKSMFGFLNGGARVPAGGSSRQQKFAARDCIEAVVASLVKKIIGTIKTRVGP